MTYEVPLYNQVNFELELYEVPTYNEVDFEIGEEDSVVELPKAEITLTTYTITTSKTENVTVNLQVSEITLTTYPVSSFAEDKKVVDIPIISLEVTTYPISTRIIEHVDRFVDLPIVNIELTTYAITASVTKNANKIWFDKTTGSYFFRIRGKDIAELDYLGNLNIKGVLTEEHG